MHTNKNIGLILCGDSDKVFELSPSGSLHGYTLKKVLVTGTVSPGLVSQQYPEAEIVQDKHAILNDAILDLIVVAVPVSHYSDLVEEIVRTGKAVRIVTQT